MDTITLGTFNCENLFARYRFRGGLDPAKEGGFMINDVAFDIYGEHDKRLTAEAIRAAGADILGLQEVESLPVLDTFTSRLLDGAGYSQRVSIHGNDPRNIDIGVLSRLPVTRLRTWRHLRSRSGAPLFSRDLLEVDVEVPGADGSARTLTLFVNHLKSMMEGRARTRDRRVEQVQALLRVVTDRVGPAFDGNFVIMGDMNDYLDTDDDGTTTALRDLASHPRLVNANEVLAPGDRWTHYFAGHKDYRQLDFLWIGRALYERAGRPAPVVIRQGLPRRADRYQGPRFTGVGDSQPKASDHCAVAVTLPVSALL